MCSRYRVRHVKIAYIARTFFVQGLLAVDAKFHDLLLVDGCSTADTYRIEYVINESIPFDSFYKSLCFLSSRKWAVTVTLVIICYPYSISYMRLNVPIIWPDGLYMLSVVYDSLN